MSIQNGPNSLASLFNDNILSVPSFQRAYAWEQPHLQDFVDDILGHPKANDKKYFFGTILLTLNPVQDLSTLHDKYDVVDGQQRLTTTCIFFAVALSKLQSNASYSNLYKTFFERILKSNNIRKFLTIQEDECFFEPLLFPTQNGTFLSLASCTTPSQKRLFLAKDFFEKFVFAIDLSVLEGMLKILYSAQVLIYAVDTPIEATQIFELQNDRGKRLTNLEALKSFLMHGLYLYAGNSTTNDLLIVQSNFAQIYRNVEKLEDLYGAPDEDQLLSYHCIAFELSASANETAELWRKPKELIRHLLSRLPQSSRAAWIKDCSGRLNDSYECAHKILAARSQSIPLDELSALGRIAPFWPLLLKCWKYSNQSNSLQFNTTVRLMESFACRAAIAGKRSSTGDSLLRNLARDFTGDFKTLDSSLDKLRNDWDIPRLFALNLDSENFYQWESIATYVLWRYENYLRSKTGQQSGRSSWEEFVRPANDAVRFQKDHIEPKNPANPNLARLVKWDINDKTSRPFGEVFLHRIGNLVLDNFSNGSAKGDGDFSSRIKHYTAQSTFLSQGEIVHRFANKDSKGAYIWDEAAIKKRQAEILKFALANM